MRRAIGGLALLAAAVGGAACSEAELEAILPYYNDELALAGEFCTTDPADVVYATKVLFVVDCSDSMRWNDPDGERAAAIRDVITTYAAEETVQFGIIRFGSVVVRETETFTKDMATLDAALAPITDPLDPAQYLGGTDYIGALQEALNMIITDRVANPQDEDARYITVFLTDGAPQAADSDPTITVDRILELVATMRTYGATVHTMMLSAGLQGVPPEFLTILEDMADEGGGEYRQLAGASTIGAVMGELLDLREILRLFTLEEMFVHDLHTVTAVRDGEVGVHADSDGDGIPDFREDEIGTSPLWWDTDTDAIGDLVELRIGWDPTAHEVNELGPSDLADDDKDLLSAYEESLLGTDPMLFDTDDDGMPDGLEVRYDTNPTVRDDLGDYDGDYVPNLDEMKAHTNPRLDEDGSRADLAYTYTIEPLGRNGGRYCYRFLVENVTLRETLEIEDMAAGHNTILATVIDRPEDAPSARGHAAFGRAEILYREPTFREPNALTLELEPEDFVR